MEAWMFSGSVTKRMTAPDQLDLFGAADRIDSTADETETSPVRSQLRDLTAQLAKRGIYIGTSSWKYPGWQGLIYSPERYLTRGRFSESKFNRECLAEFAETFSTVSVDGAYYQFPAEKYLAGLAAQVPREFKFSLKVTDEITIRQFPQIARMGKRAGQANPNFLNADLFIRNFLTPCETIRENIGLLMFEFSRFPLTAFPRPADFSTALDEFLDRLPKGWDYGIEIRNEEFLGREYFATLRRHGVTHIFNSWEAMPPVNEQITKAGDTLDGLHTGARFLLKPGRNFQSAVTRFSPYQEISDAYPAAREAITRLIHWALLDQTRLYLYVNNRLEGCSPLTLLAAINNLPRHLLEKFS